MKGKEKCEFLKEIRKNMAEANGIPYVPRECDFEGECSGTCPFCEKEAADLLAALKEKELKGEEIKKDEFSTLLLEKGCMEFDDAYKALVAEIEKVKEMMEPVGVIRYDDEYLERLKKEEEEIERIHREQMTPLMGDIDFEHADELRKRGNTSWILDEEYKNEEEEIKREMEVRKRKEKSLVNKVLLRIKNLFDSPLKGYVEYDK